MPNFCFILVLIVLGSGSGSMVLFCSHGVCPAAELDGSERARVHTEFACAQVTKCAFSPFLAYFAPKMRISTSASF